MTVVYLNGEYKNDGKTLISHRDCGFTTGIAVFDSMLVVDGTPVHPQEHHERLIHDTETVVGLIPNLSFEEFSNVYSELLQRNDLQSGYARIRSTITGGIVDGPLEKTDNPTVLIDAGTSSPPPKTPITCAIITDYPRVAGCTLENCKRVDYSRSYTARQKAKEIGADEAILTNTDGNIACGATSNIFIKENGALITPPLSDGVLAGVTRRKLIENENVKEESISIDRLHQADESFLTNSFMNLRKIQKII